MPRGDTGRGIAAWADERIAQILAAPRMWGAGLEAVEMQVLTLLEVRALAVHLERELAAPRRVLDAYVEHVQSHFPGRPAAPLHVHLGEELTDDEQFVRVLSDVCSRLIAEPQPDFFSETYLGIELLFKPAQFLSAQTVTGFYEDFRRATRSLARVGSGRTGRVERSIEVGTDFELESVQITPLNGVPARARIALGIPYGQIDHDSKLRVRTALDQILDVAEWADSSEAEAVQQFGKDLDEDTRTRVLLQTLRLAPRGGIDEVRIGGTYVGRSPVRLRRFLAPKVMGAVAAGVAPSPYDQTALIRAIDLDRGSIVHGNHLDRRISCHLSPEHAAGIHRVGVRARIVGKRYDPHNGQPFVIVEEIEVVADRQAPPQGARVPSGAP
jgi:hypothetical protein